jgi:hypothetical protein
VSLDENITEKNEKMIKKTCIYLEVEIHAWKLKEIKLEVTISNRLFGINMIDASLNAPPGHEKL